VHNHKKILFSSYTIFAAIPKRKEMNDAMALYSRNYSFNLLTETQLTGRLEKTGNQEYLEKSPRQYFAGQNTARSSIEKSAIEQSSIEKSAIGRIVENNNPAGQSFASRIVTRSISAACGRITVGYARALERSTISPGMLLCGSNDDKCPDPRHFPRDNESEEQELAKRLSKEQKTVNIPCKALPTSIQSVTCPKAVPIAITELCRLCFSHSAYRTPHKQAIIPGGDIEIHKYLG
jgi:hypothetical protein